MSLLPIFDDTFHFVRPSRLLDQHFGLNLHPDDLFEPLVLPKFHRNYLPHGYLRNWRSAASQSDIGSTVHYDKDKFHANLDVQQFKPNEITVKVTGENTITVEGKHEEQQDEHGYISRQFVRRYMLPKTYDINKVESKLSSDGVLTITSPKIDGKAVEHKNIPIAQTGEPLKQVKNQKEK